MKTNSLSEKALEHLESIGYQLQDTVTSLMDAPYLFIIDNKVSAVFSANKFRNSSEELVKEERVLKLRPADEKKKAKKLPEAEKLAYKLVGILNKSVNSKITGYDVSWDVQESSNPYFKGVLEVFPISPQACGDISLKHLKIILNFAEENPLYHFAFGYTNVNNEKEKYGTYTPCIKIY